MCFIARGPIGPVFRGRASAIRLPPFSPRPAESRMRLYCWRNQLRLLDRRNTLQIIREKSLCILAASKRIVYILSHAILLEIEKSMVILQTSRFAFLDIESTQHPNDSTRRQFHGNTPQTMQEKSPYILTISNRIPCHCYHARSS